MAAIEDLIASIPDADLRDALASEVRRLKESTNFGLVYERHLPECVLLPATVGTTVGTTVRLRKHPDDPAPRIVRSTTKTTATVAPFSGEPTERVSLRDLLVVRDFDEPIFPSLSALRSVRRGAARDPHLVIRSENYHALQLLQYTHAGTVDVIYIDPPYNTGAQDWQYNNDYVDKNDRWRHSKWLSFMERRLRLAKPLLKDDGVLIITVDEHEVHHLGALLDQLYKEYDRHMVTVVTNPKGSPRGNFGRVDEYIFFCVPQLGRPLIASRLLKDAGDDDDFDGLDADGDDDDDPDNDSESIPYEFQLFRRRGSDSLRADRPKRFYPIYINEATREIVGAGDPLPLGVKPSFRKVKGMRPIWPIDTEKNDRVWRWQASRVRDILKGPDREGRYLTLGRYDEKRDSWTVNLAVPKRDFVKQKTVWWEKRHDSGTHGTTLLQKLLGRSRGFAFPKSLYLVRDTLDLVVRDRPEAVILDFFAGSGTTLHATCLLNAEDQGRRRCIVVTNNEVSGDTAKRLHSEGQFLGDKAFEQEGVFEGVAMPRIKAAITGKQPDGKSVPGNYIGGRPMKDGFRESVVFAALDYIDPDRIELGTDTTLLDPVMWLKAGAKGTFPSSKSPMKYRIYPDRGYAVLFDSDAFSTFVAALAEADSVHTVYLVTEYNDTYAAMSSRLPTRRVEMVPRDYLRWFRDHTGEGAE
jgi:adenine-specific DNA-methyltransferase